MPVNILIVTLYTNFIKIFHVCVIFIFFCAYFTFFFNIKHVVTINIEKYSFKFFSSIIYFNSIYIQNYILTFSLYYYTYIYILIKSNHIYTVLNVYTLQKGSNLFRENYVLFFQFILCLFISFVLFNKIKIISLYIFFCYFF